MSHKIVKLDDICIKIVSGGTPKSTMESFYNPKEIPWLKTGEVNYSRIYDTATYISQEGLDRSSAKLIPINSVIVAMYGQGDTAGRVAINKIPLSTNQACCNLIIDNSKANYEYIYYLLTILYEKLVSLKNGGAQPNLNVKTIKTIEIVLPDLKVQNIVASILSAYDNLIENNQKQIKLLEEAAQRLYKEWFIDLRFPGHEDVEIIDGLPKDWNKCSIDDIFQIKYGRTLPTSKISNKGAYPVYGANGIIGYYDEKNCDNYTVLITSRGNGSGDVSRTHDIESFVTNNSFIVKPLNALYRTSYVYQLMKHTDFKSVCTGSAQPQLTNISISTIIVEKPNEELIDLFCDSTDALYQKIESLLRQNRFLEEARDRLLPKLMSGEIEV